MKRFNRFMYPPWLKRCRAIAAQFCIPFCIFQGIRVIIFPTTFDALLLAVLILIATAIYMEIF
ncbi:hypothetical protein DRW41_14840 [Neobacillus piezotolerans]|uniref:Uncharacterized protein n=1 Tax=Neobacillus piezotolerans TaxID=2259171 RepID=A0A3D8GP67_9BACI|nr:hypothetical protein [Neobacillus piezotolerans]RDU36294.1 hypothetical protein DRW41_14840 [Neobacillus piezotolerans]